MNQPVIAEQSPSNQSHDFHILTNSQQHDTIHFGRSDNHLNSSCRPEFKYSPTNSEMFSQKSDNDSVNDTSYNSSQTSERKRCHECEEESSKLSFKKIKVEGEYPHASIEYIPSPKCVTENGSCNGTNTYAGHERSYIYAKYGLKIDDDKAHDPTEAGLSLLFAASLIQQGEGSFTGKREDLYYNLDETCSWGQSNRHDEVTPVSEQTWYKPSHYTPQSTMKCLHEDAIPAHRTNFTAAVSCAMGGSNIDSSFIIVVPTERDVLCGRGGGINKHNGNVIYRRVVEYNKTLYKQVPKRHRMLVSQSIVQVILNSGGRFLQQQDTWTSSSTDDKCKQKWKEIPFRRAVQKTSQALRERNELETDDVIKDTVVSFESTRQDLVDQSCSTNHGTIVESIKLQNVETIVSLKNNTARKRRKSNAEVKQEISDETNISKSFLTTQSLISNITHDIPSIHGALVSAVSIQESCNNRIIERNSKNPLNSDLVNAMQHNKQQQSPCLMSSLILDTNATGLLQENWNGLSSTSSPALTVQQV